MGAIFIGAGKVHGIVSRRWCSEKKAFTNIIKRGKEAVTVYKIR
jgi:hypothetical protein